MKHPATDELDSNSAARSGNVFLVRGLLGIFSTGMDDLKKQLQASGVAAVALQHTGERSAAQLIAQQPDLRNAPLVIIGHSLGANAAVEICDLLAKENVTVDLLITLDPVRSLSVPSNVRTAINYYRRDGVLYPLPLFRGYALRQEPGNGQVLRNVDLKSIEQVRKGTNHFNIDTNKPLQQMIVAQVLEVCPPTDPRRAQVSAQAERQAPSQEARTQ